MAQQLNLFDARFAPQTLRWSARHGLMIAVAALLLALATAQALQWSARRALASAAGTETTMAPLRAQVMALSASGPTGAAAELALLRRQEAGQRRIRAALDAGAAGAHEGPADYLTALARQATGALWITGFAVSDDGTAIELEGRMSDPGVLTDYLRRLNAEPRFKGRPFAQLSLKSVDSNGQSLPFTEFALRSTASTGGNSPTATQP